MTLEFVNGGMLTTVQDLGRYGFQKDGMVVGGAMDALAFKVANLLVGNEETAAVLEITMLGPRILFREEGLIALTGGDLSATIEGKPLKLGRPTYVRSNSLLTFGKPLEGCWVFLAVSGGVAVPQILGSYATYLRGKIGGLQGRPLRNGDVLEGPGPTAKAQWLIGKLRVKAAGKAFVQAPFLLDPDLSPSMASSPIIRALRGPEFELFSENSRQYIWQEQFMVTSDADRMGYKLQGVTLALEEPREMLSSAVTLGTVQVPAEGNPIILMADRQTTGGYPRILQVISADIPALVQVPPGQTIRFEEVRLEEAQRLNLRLNKKLELLKRALDLTVWK